MIRYMIYFTFKIFLNSFQKYYKLVLLILLKALLCSNFLNWHLLFFIFLIFLICTQLFSKLLFWNLLLFVGGWLGYHTLFCLSDYFLTSTCRLVIQWVIHMFLMIIDFCILILIYLFMYDFYYEWYFYWHTYIYMI